MEQSARFRASTHVLCLQGRLTHTHATPGSSSVLPRRGLGPTLPTAALGKGQHQLSCSHFLEANILARGGRASLMPPHGRCGGDVSSPALTSSGQPHLHPHHKSVLVCSPNKIQSPLSYVLPPVRTRSRSLKATTGYPRVVSVRALY